MGASKWVGSGGGVQDQVCVWPIDVQSAKQCEEVLLLGRVGAKAVAGGANVSHSWARCHKANTKGVEFAMENLRGWAWSVWQNWSRLVSVYELEAQSFDAGDNPRLNTWVCRDLMKPKRQDICACLHQTIENGKRYLRIFVMVHVKQSSRKVFPLSILILGVDFLISLWRSLFELVNIWVSGQKNCIIGINWEVIMDYMATWTWFCKLQSMTSFKEFQFQIVVTSFKINFTMCWKWFLVHARLYGGNNLNCCVCWVECDQRGSSFQSNIPLRVYQVLYGKRSIAFEFCDACAKLGYSMLNSSEGIGVSQSYTIQEC